jgi:hypothetical protein
MNNEINIEEIVKGELPEWTLTYWEEATKSIDCNAIFTFTSMLAMASVAIGTSARVEPKPFYFLYPGLYIAIVGKPSTKKSPAISIMLKPLEVIQQKNKKEYFRLKAEYTRQKKDESNDENKEELKPPVYKVSVLSDTTMEALAEELLRNELGILVKRDELAHFFKSLNAYKNGGGDLQSVLELYDNETIIITRKSLEIPIQIDKPFVSIIGGLQPNPLTEIFKSSDVGLIERFIFAFPDKDDQRRKYSRAIISENSMEDYLKGMVDLHEQSKSIVNSDSVQNYTFSTEADLLWEEWQNAVEMDEELESMYQKAFARCAKFSLLIEILNSPKREFHEISIKSLKLAIKLTELYIENHVKVLNYLEDGELLDKMSKMKSYLIKQFKNPKLLRYVDGLPALEIRRIYSNKAGGTKGDKDATYDLLELLAQKRFGSMLPRNPKSKEPKSFHLFSKYWK